MALAPDPGDITPPADPAAAEPVRLFTPFFWIAIGVSITSLVAGVILALVVPRLWHKSNPAPADATPAAAAQPAPASLPDPSPALQSPASPSVASDLNGRLNQIQGAQNKLADAAAEALAVATLSDAAQTSQPFADALASLDRILPNSRDLYELRTVAATGAPSRAALAADFDAAAAKAIVAARAPDAKSGLVAKALYALSAVVVVRRVDSTVNIGPDAALAKAGRLAAEGDLEGALAATQKLSTKAQTALGDWRMRAQRRVDIDRHLAGLRATALDDLAAAQRSGG